MKQLCAAVVAAVVIVFGLSGCSLNHPSESVTTFAPTAAAQPSGGTGSNQTGVGGPVIVAGGTGSGLPSAPTAVESLPSSPSPAASVLQAQDSGSRQSSAAAEPNAVVSAFDYYLYLVSGLDEYLNKSWIAPLATVATQRLATATVRAARAFFDSGEHGVGVIRGARATVKMLNATTAGVVDCEDHFHAYVLDPHTGKPDPTVSRGYFVGAAQLVKQNGKWLVDVYAVTRSTCAY